MIKKFLLKNKLTLQNIASGFAIALAVLIFSVGVSYVLYQPKEMSKRGFSVEIKPQVTNVGGVMVGNLADAKAVKVVDIATLIKNADLAAGEKVFKKCATCHTVQNGGGNKIGPNLFGIVGRKKAAVGGFAYSQALQQKGGSWTIEDMDKWLTKPKDFVPGTKMGFAGLKKDKDRANVIAYLKSIK